MPHLVIRLGQWTELCPEPKSETYVCRKCRGAVNPGNDGKAISQPTGGYEYDHYQDNCVQDTPAKTVRKKRAGKNEHLPFLLAGSLAPLSQSERSGTNCEH